MKKKRTQKEVHKQALGQQLEDPQTHGVRTKPRKKARTVEAGLDEREAIDAGQSAVILSLAREQQEEEEQMNARERSGADTSALGAAIRQRRDREVSDSDNDWDVDERELDEYGTVDFEDEYHFSAAEEAAFDAFMRKGDDAAASSEGGLLSDVILSKMQQARSQQAEEGTKPAGGDAPTSSSAGNADILEVYADVGNLLQRYTTGKLPKAFKIVPHLRNWEEIVFTMRPELWSPHATYAATRMFISQLNANQAQRFLNLVLLNKVRDDIREHKRLHCMLFEAVKKAVFKPGAFYKGFVLPLLKAGDCTLREAVIISSVLNRVSIPVDHSAAALLKMAEMPYSGITSFFIKTLVDKKYSLPYRVVDALVDHFCSFKTDARELPVVWHLSLLAFVQRYKHEIRSEDKQLLRELLKEQFHHGVSPEVLRELSHGRSRGAKAPDEPGLPVTAQIGGGRIAEDLLNMAPIPMEGVEF